MFRVPSISVVCGLAAIALSSCNTVLTLDYEADRARGVLGDPVFGVGSFIDQRGVAPTQIGAVGVPGVSVIAPVTLSKIHLSIPVDQAVHNSFTHALDHRHMLSAGTRPRFLIAGEILELKCEDIVNPYAVVHLRVNLIDAATHRVIFTKEQTRERQAAHSKVDSPDAMPVLRNLTSRALQDAVDKAIDDPDMRAAIDEHS